MQGFSCLFVFFFLIQFSFTGTIDDFSSRKIETHPIGTIRYSALRDWKCQVESRLSLIERFVSGLKKNWDVENRPRHPGWGKPAGKPLKFECQDRTKYIRNSVCITSVQSSFFFFFLEMSSGFGNLWATVKILLANEILIDKIVEQYSTTKV